MTSTLATVIADHRKTAVATLTQAITTNPETHPELLQNLERIWALPGSLHTDNDQIWIEAATALTPDLRKNLRDDAYDNALHSAARCLTYLTATTTA